MGTSAVLMILLGVAAARPGLLLDELPHAAPAPAYGAPAPVHIPAPAPVYAPAPAPVYAPAPVHLPAPAYAHPEPHSLLHLPQGTRVDIRDPRGQFSHGYSDPYGTQVSEQGRLITTNDGWESVIVKEGSFSYVSPDGTPISVKYIADENGFRAIGDHIPK